MFYNEYKKKILGYRYVSTSCWNMCLTMCMLIFQIEIVLGKTANFDELMLAGQNDRNNIQEQSWIKNCS